MSAVDPTLELPPRDLDLVELGAVAPTPTGRRRFPRGIERMAGVLALLVVWQVASSTGMLHADTLAGPATVAKTAWHLTQDGTLPSAIWVSLKRVLLGLAIGVPIATSLALVAGLSRIGDDLVDAPMQMLRFVPVIALQPLIVLWFGIGEAPKLFLIAFAVAFPMYINTYVAIKSLDRGHFELAKTLGLDRFTVIRKIVLPGALPGFLVGLRLALAVSWLILVFAEQINAVNGIGYLMITAQEFFQTDVIVVGVVVYAVLGLVCDALVRMLERRALAWQPRI
jgi:sulfonate transport system permease protein